MNQDAIMDFLTFRRMVTPIIIQVIFWLLTAAVVIVGAVLVITGDNALERISGLFAFVLGPLVVRVYAEILIVLFRIHEALDGIENNTDRIT